MVSSTRARVAWLLGLGLALAAGLLLWSRSGRLPQAAPAGTPREASPSGGAGIPKIGLARLEAKPENDTAGQRDVFGFAPAPRPSAAPAPASPPPTLAAGPPSAPPVTTPPAPAVPPLNVRYVGAVSNARGLKVAILMTDRKEILAGQAGEVVANRFRIVAIGYESVDIQDLGSDRVRRIPFKGN